MSANQLPLIDTKTYFSDPSIPDGEGAGYVGADGIVYDRNKQPIGRDKDHPSHSLDRLKSVIDSLGQDEVAAYEAERNKPGAQINIGPPRQITRLFEGTCLGSPIKVGLDNRGDYWVLEVGRPAWQRLTSANLPPLPQE